MTGCRATARAKYGASWLAVMTAVAMLFAREARAQETFIVPSTRVIQAGPVALYPQIALRDVGTDSNVHLDSSNPSSDLTYSLTPRLYALVPIGNTRFIGTGTGDLVYYQTSSDQRSLTLVVDGRYEVTSPGFRPFVELAFASRGERVGFEIDARARHTQSTVLGGIDVDLTPITALTAWAGHSVSAYDEDDEYLSFLLADQLNHTRDSAAAGARFRVTSLTTVLIAAEFERDRFELAPLRNADSFRIAPAIALDSGGALTGNAKAGFRSFTPSYPDVPSFRGLVGTARLHYALPDIVRLDLEANRDLSYSYDPIQPYYMESGARLTAAQRVLGPIELIGIVERREIRSQRIGGQSFDGRREVTTSLGAGMGVQMNRQIRLALTYEQTERVSSEPVGRNYERTRILGSIRYGL
jgi:hypothetical protein